MSVLNDVLDDRTVAVKAWGPAHVHTLDKKHFTLKRNNSLTTLNYIHESDYDRPYALKSIITIYYIF